MTKLGFPRAGPAHPAYAHPMITRLAVALAAIAALVAVPATGAAAHDGDHGTGASRADYGLVLEIDRVRAATGQVKFTVTPEGFTYVKVPYDGAPNVAGQGHAHLYATNMRNGKTFYIGWTGNGLTDWSDPRALKKGRTYRIFAIFSENDHTEVPSIMSNGVLVTIL